MEYKRKLSEEMERRNSNFTSLKKVKVAKEKFKCVAVLTQSGTSFGFTGYLMILPKNCFCTTWKKLW